MKQGLVFPKEYVQQLREEAKANRLKAEQAEAQAKANQDAGKAAEDAAVAAEQQKMKKALAMKDLEAMCERAGVKIDANQIYQEGVEPEKAFNEFVEKNPALFKKEPTRIHGLDLDGGPAAKLLTEGSVMQIKNDAAARSLMGRVYEKLVRNEKEGIRRKVA